MGWVYRVTNKIDRSKYIGKTKNDNVELRWRDERCRPHAKLKDAFEEFGLDNFLFETIMEISQETHGGDWKDYLNMYEKLEIENNNSIYPNGYNLQSGGDVNYITHPDTCQKRRELSGGKNNPIYGLFGAKNKNAKKVEQWTKSGEFVKLWDCIVDVARELGIRQECVSKVCHNNRKSTGGFVWKFPDAQ